MNLMNDDYGNFADKLQESGFKYIGSGASRNTFLRKKVVVKVPQSLYGLMDNIAEAVAYNKYRNQATDRGMYLAPSRLMVNGCLMMMAVVPNDNYDNLPLWAQCIDGSQAGYYRGRLVAYDYAHDISEGRLNDKFYHRARELEKLSALPDNIPKYVREMFA